MLVDDPNFVNTRFENQGVDVMVDFAVIVRLHW